ncbi:MAG: chemotaxis protein CheW [Peptococcaceae bacterium]|nr:chemotaxis protein CheW [Peptococcaceae bacterium]
MEEQLVTFLLGQEEFAIDIMRVHEIIKIPAITKVPRSSRYIEGVINLRGNVVPVVSLNERFGTQKAGDSHNSRIIVLQIDGKTVGIIVDQVTEVLRLDDSNIEPPPALAGNIDAGFIRGVGKVGNRLVVLLAVDRILEGEKLTNYA